VTLETAVNYSRQGHGGFFYQKKHRRSRQQRDEQERLMILASIRITIPPRNHGEALKILGSIAELCRDYPGCISCNVYGDLQEENVLMLEEVWRSEEDMDIHLRSDEYRNLLLVLEMARKQPEIRFDTISSSTGIETIEKARTLAR
jgi:quinol monooxygenase YgiN